MYKFYSEEVLSNHVTERGWEGDRPKCNASTRKYDLEIFVRNKIRVMQKTAIEETVEIKKCHNDLNRRKYE
jgi:hypothetical protein